MIQYGKLSFWTQEQIQKQGTVPNLQSNVAYLHFQFVFFFNAVNVSDLASH